MTRRKWISGALWVVLFAIIVIGTWGPAEQDESPESSAKITEAYTMAQMFLEDRIKNPDTLDYPLRHSSDCVKYIGNSVYHFQINASVENDFGVRKRLYFEGDIKDKGDTWELLNSHLEER